MPSITDFINDNASALAEALRHRLKPIHDPSVDQLHAGIDGLLRKPRGLQGHIISACVKAYQERNAIILGMAMGTGKTNCAIAITHLKAEGRPYSCLIVCPPHLCGKWEREIRSTVPDPVVIQVDGWEEWLLLARGKNAKLTGPTFFVSPLSTAKLGARWIPAVFTKKRLGGSPRSLLCCPECFKPITYYKMGEEKNATMQFLRKRKRYCRHCKSACWQNTKPHKVAPSRIIKKHLNKWFDTVICDEQHMMKAGDTLAGESFSHFVSAGKKVLILTGTLIAGRSIDLMPTLFRLFPQKFVSKGIKWDDLTKFNKEYGRIETASSQRQSIGQGSFFKGKHKSYKKVMPGVMPSFYRDFLADCTVFCTLKEMMQGSGDLPKLVESSEPIEMSQSMAAEYACMKKALVDAFMKVRNEDPETAMKFIGRLAETLATWPDDPSGWEPIGYTDRDGIWHEVYRPRDMEGEATPKEKRLVETILRERSEGRQVWVFVTRDATADRLLKLMVKSFISCAHLTTAVPPVKREDWIRDYGPGMDCILSHPELVQTGLDFFGNGPGKYGARYNFSTIIHY